MISALPASLPRWHAPRVRAVWASAVVFTAALAPCAAQTWTGGGASPSWNDAANWDVAAPPLPGLSATFTFDAAAGNAFGFGGAEPFRASSLRFTPKAGRFSITAPEIVLGGSADEDINDGWILEPIFTLGSVVNESTQTQTLNADVRLGWDTRFDASNGNIVVNGRLAGADFALVKTGGHDLIANGGAIDLDRADIKEGRLVLLGASGAIRSFGLQSDAEIALLNGASLVSAPPADASPDAPLVVYPTVSLSGVSKATGAPCAWDLAGRPLRKVSGALTLAHGASLTNAGAIAIFSAPGQTNDIACRVEGGATLQAKGLVLGATESSELRFSRRIALTVAGTLVPGARQTTIDLGGSSLQVGARDGGGDTRSVRNSLTVTDGARIVNAGAFQVAGGKGDDFNTATFSGGATLACKGLRVGLLGSSNGVDVAGAGTALDLGDEPMTIGTANEWGNPHANAVVLRDRAAIDRCGEISVGRSGSWVENNDGDNSLHVASGARLTSQNVLIGVNGGRCKLSANNRMVVEGAGTFWNASGRGVLIGRAGSGISSANRLVVADGAVATNLGTVAVGVGNGGQSVGNMLAITNGAQVFSTGAVQIGVAGQSEKGLTVTSNVAVVQGGPMGPARWDLGGDTLAVGAASAWNGPSRGNRLLLKAGGQVVNAGDVTIGRGEGDFKDNQVVLAGGLLVARSLKVTDWNGIGVELGPWEQKPVLVEKDIAFGHDTFIDPKAHSGAKPGRHPLLAWKGKAEGLDRIKLAPGTARKSWKLEILEDQKRIYIVYQ